MPGARADRADRGVVGGAFGGRPGEAHPGRGRGPERLERAAELLRADGLHVFVDEDRLRCAREAVAFEIDGMGELGLLQDTVFVHATEGGIDVRELRGQWFFSFGVFASAEEVVRVIFDARPVIACAGDR